MQRSIKANLKLKLLGAMLAMAVITPQLSAQAYQFSSPITPDYTILIAWPSMTGTACYLGYSTAPGNWEIGTITNAAVTPKITASGTADFPGWTLMASFNVGNNLFYAQYNANTGHLQINEMSPSCDSISNVIDTSVQPNLSQILALHWSDNTPFLMAYQQGQAVYNTGGDMQIYTIGMNSAGIPSSVDLTRSYPLGGGYFSLMPYYINNAPYFLAYSGDNSGANAQGYLILPSGTSLVYTGNWGPGWGPLIPALTTQQFAAYTPITPPWSATPGAAFANDSIVTVAGGFNNVVNNYFVLGLDGKTELFAPFYIGSGPKTGPGFLAYDQTSGQVQVWTF